MKLTQDQRLQDIAALALAALVLAGVAILQVVATGSTGATDVTAPSAPTHVLGQHFERPPATAPPAVPARIPVSVAPVRAKPVSPAQPKSPPATRLVTVTSIVDCGTGGATANVELSTVTDGTGSYASDGKITVTNSLQRPIQIDNLVVRVDFTDGTSETIPLSDASGVTINTGGDNVLHAPLNTTKQPMAAAIDTLDYHVAGEQRCPGRGR